MYFSSSVSNMEQKRLAINKCRSSLEKLDLFTNVLTYRIYEVRHELQTDLAGLIAEKQQLLKRTDVTSSQVTAEGAEIDRKMADTKWRHKQILATLEEQLIVRNRDLFGRLTKKTL